MKHLSVLPRIQLRIEISHSKGLLLTLGSSEDCEFNEKTRHSVGMSIDSSFLSSVSIYTSKATAVSRRSKIIQLIQIPALIALILAISGGTDQASSNVSDQHSGKTETRAAIILFLIIYLAVCFFWVITVRDLGKMASSQKRLFLGIFLALPFIAVRLLYSLITDFGNNPKFSFVDGDAAIQLGMATIEEIIVVLMYTILGLMSPRSTINPAVGGGVISQETHGLATGAINPRAADASSSPYDDVPYAQAGAQHAYNQQYAAKSY